MHRLRDFLKQLVGRKVAPSAEPPFKTEGGVLRGRDGWLFLWDGSNDVHRYYTDADFFSPEDASAWANLLNQRAARIREVGAQYRHVVIPDKLSLYPHHLPMALPYPDLHPCAQIGRLFSGDALYVDLLPDLRGQRGDWPARVGCGPDGFFFRTDSHWTFEGCRVAYIRLCESLGVTPRDLADRAPPAGREMALDLGAKLTPPMLEMGRFGRVLRDSHRVSANEMVRYNEAEGLAKGAPRFVGCMVHNHNDHPEADPRRLVLFGDSFSEFRPHLLTAMLSETFRDVHFVWSTSLDHDFIARLAPDIVVSEIAERFCKRLPRDDFTVAPG